MRVPVIAVAGLVCLSASLSAQVCQGAASFSSGPVRIGAGMNFGDHAKSYGLELAAGAPTGLFASGGVSRVEYDGADGTNTGLSAQVGYAMDMTPTKSAQFCPLASFAYEKAPSTNTGFGTIEASAHAFGFGGSFGGVIPASPTMDVIPFGGAQFIAASAKASLAGVSDTESENHGNIELGAGFIFNHTLTIRPAVEIPVGLEGAKSRFAISFAFNFGASKPAK